MKRNTLALCALACLLSFLGGLFASRVLVSDLGQLDTFVAQENGDGGVRMLPEAEAVLIQALGNASSAAGVLLMTDRPALLEKHQVQVLRSEISTALEATETVGRLGTPLPNMLHLLSQSRPWLEGVDGSNEALHDLDRLETWMAEENRLAGLEEGY